MSRFWSTISIRTLIFSGLALTVSVFLILPFYWMIKTSLDTGGSLFKSPPDFFPDSWRFESYRTIFAEKPMVRWILNSILVSSVSTIFSLIIGCLGAFALSRFRYRGREAWSVVVLATQMMPPIVLVLPIYGIYVRIGLYDTLLGLIVANVAFSLPVVVWMMKSIFDSIPVEIDEAARVDGASWFTIFWRITLPLSIPGLVATGVFSFLSSWDEFMMARTVIASSENWVASLGLSSFIGAYLTPWDQIMAAAVVFTLPPVVLFLIVQKYFVQGLTAGAVKG